MITVYFWIEGADKDRSGGPWWHSQFRQETEAGRFLAEMLPFLYAYATTNVDHTCYLDCHLEWPPSYAKIKYTNEERRTQESNLEPLV